MAETVVFKGNRGGLHLLFDENENFNTILEELKAKLERAASFFSAGTTVHVPSASRLLTSDQRDELYQLLANYGLRYREISIEGQNCLVPPAAEQPAQIVPEVLVISKTLRGGQKVEYEGSVVIAGDVNPGAIVVAGGDITVLGACRGVVHAGAYGNRDATITADRLLAPQIRIAELISRAPDSLVKSDYEETARIVDGAVTIEPAIR